MDYCKLMTVPLKKKKASAKTFQVEGSSMTPLLYPGEIIEVKSSKQYNPGDVVVAFHPIQTDLILIKRIESVSSDGHIRLRGANPKESTDQFGLIHCDKVIGKMVRKLNQ